MVGKEKEGKEQLVVSLFTCAVMAVLLAILIFTNAIDEELVAIMAFGMILWPIIEMLNYKFNLYSLQGKKRNLLELKLSIISWAVMSIGLIFINFFMSNGVAWSIYPIAVIMLWPIYNFFLYLTEAYPLRK